MLKKKKSLSKNDVHQLETQAKYRAAYDKVLESIEQMQKKEGPVYEKWKAGMRAYLDSEEEKEASE